MKYSNLVVMILFLMHPLTTVAADSALYDKKPPANAYFYRVLNASDALSLEVKLDGKILARLKPLSVSDYAFSITSPIRLQLNDKEITVPGLPKSMMTLVWDGKGDSYMITEKPFANRKKARLKLFNIGSKPIMLKTANSKTTVIEPVAPGHYGFRDVNALHLPFAVHENNTRILTTEKIALRKGIATSIFMVQTGKLPLYILSDAQR